MDIDHDWGCLVGILLVLGLIVLLFWGYTPPKLQEEDPYPPTQIEGKLGDDVIIIDGETFHRVDELSTE